MTAPQPPAWYLDHANLILLTRFLADKDWSADEVARAVEKPWLFESEFMKAISPPCQSFSRAGLSRASVQAALDGLSAGLGGGTATVDSPSIDATQAPGLRIVR